MVGHIYVADTPYTGKTGNTGMGYSRFTGTDRSGGGLWIAFMNGHVVTSVIDTNGRWLSKADIDVRLAGMN